jgi:hypothetical protein
MNRKIRFNQRLTVLLVTLGISISLANCHKPKVDDNSSVLAVAAIAIQKNTPIASSTTDTSIPGPNAITMSYTLGGTIAGLTGSGLVLQNNAGSDLTISSGASSFSFSTAILSGSTYSVTIKTQPNGLTCTVVNGSGTITANVTNISLTCSINTYTVGGTISGLTTSGLVLLNNAGDDLTIASGLTSFAFSTKVTGVYVVTIKTQPTAAICSVIGGSGTATANVTGIAINCVGSGSVWTARTLPSSAEWSSVTFGNGIFVAVAQGPSSIAATSPDGITWTSRTLPSSSFWSSVIYGNGIFIAVALSTTAAATSLDGITWTARTLPSLASWNSVVYGNGVFVAVAGGPSNVAATSPDGITWTARTLPSSSFWDSVIYINSSFVVVAGGPSNKAATSPDGITWTARTMPTMSTWLSLTYGNGVFVTPGYGSANAATSSDGITWIARTLPSSSNWRSVVYGNGIFVTVAGGSSNVAATSLDGITWTSQTLPSSSNWYAVAYGNGIFVAVSNGSNAVATSR